MRTRKRAWMRAAASLIVVIGLTACGASTGGDTANGGDGGDGGDGGGDGGSSQVGYMSVSEESSASGDLLAPSQTGDVRADGGFFSTTPSVPDDVLNDLWGDLPDTCEVTTVEPTEGFGDLPLDIDIELELDSLDAGPTVTIDDADSTFLTASRDTVTFEGNSVTIYSSGDAIAATLPDTMTASAAGATFPAFSSVPLPSVAPFSLTQPATTTGIPADQEFTWTNASNDPDTLILIMLTSLEVVDSLPVTTFVDCYAADDGSFTLPGTPVLGDNFSGTLTSAAREARAVSDVGAAKLILSVSRSIVPTLVPF